MDCVRRTSRSRRLALGIPVRGRLFVPDSLDNEVVRHDDEANDDDGKCYYECENIWLHFEARRRCLEDYGLNL